MTMNKEQKEMIQALQGHEIELIPYGIVMIQNNKVIQYGKVITLIDDSNYEEIIEAYHYTEYGTTNINSIMKIEGF